MATVTITVPQDFIQNMNQFVANVRKVIDLTEKFTVSVQRLPSAQSLFRSHRVMTGQVNRLQQIFHKISTMLQRVTDSMIRTLGTAGQLFVRGLMIAADFLGPIIGIIGTVGGFVISGVITAAMWSPTIIRWLWDKALGLGDAMLKDQLEALGTFSTIGGLRAFRAVTAGLPSDPGMLMGMIQARGDVTSRQLIALKMLGIKAQANTADMMVDATIAAAMYMKSQPKGLELRVAGAQGITDLVDSKRLMALEEWSVDDLQALKDMYEHYKPLMEISDKAVKGWANFSLQVKATTAQVENIIAKQLADPSSPLVQTLTQLSKNITYFMQELAKSPVLDEIIKELGDRLDEFGKWMKKPDTDKKIHNMMQDIGEIVSLVGEAIRIIGGIVRDWSGIAPVAAPVVGAGRRALGRRVGIDHPREPPPIAKYPGRARFLERTGMLRKPPDLAPEDVPGLKVPTKPEEAPETVDQAIKGGFVRPGGRVQPTGPAAQRWPRMGELKAAAKDQLLKEGLTSEQAEKGANGLVGQAIAESGLRNVYHDQGKISGRAGGYVPSIYGADHARGQAMVKWITKQGGDPNDTTWQARYMAHEVMTGSSYGPSRKAIKEGSQDEVSDALTRNFEAPASKDSPATLAERRRNAHTVAGVKTKVTEGKIQGYTVEDIQRMDKKPSAVKRPSAKPLAAVPTSETRDYSKDSKGNSINPVVFSQAEDLAKTGDVKGVYKFINSHGGHVDANYCGDFVGAVTRAQGGTPPKGYPVATSWANYGTPVKPGDEQPGDVAIYMRNHKPGETGGHVGFVGSKGALGKGRFQFFGANVTRESTASESDVIFRRPPKPEQDKTETPQVAQTKPPVATEKGTASNNLGTERQALFANELKDPETRRLLANSVNAEVGGQGTEAEHAYMETIFNRAASRHKSLKDTIEDRGYYPPTTTNKLNRTPHNQEHIDELTNQVMQGSNVSNYGTGNESGSVHSGGAPVTRDFGRNRERIVRENADKAWVNQHIKDPTVVSQQSQAPPKPEFKVESKPRSFPEHGAPSIAYLHPIDTLKVDNRSDYDIGKGSGKSGEDNFDHGNVGDHSDLKQTKEVQNRRREILHNSMIGHRAMGAKVGIDKSKEKLLEKPKPKPEARKEAPSPADSGANELAMAP